MFECFGAKKKVVIAMAHIGALPGAPLYDAKGGMAKLIDDVLADQLVHVEGVIVVARRFGEQGDTSEQLGVLSRGDAREYDQMTVLEGA